MYSSNFYIVEGWAHSARSLKLTIGSYVIACTLAGTPLNFVMTFLDVFLVLETPGDGKKPQPAPRGPPKYMQKGAPLRKEG